MSSLGDPFQPNYREGFWSRWFEGLKSALKFISLCISLVLIGTVLVLIVRIVLTFFFWVVVPVVAVACIVFVVGLIGMRFDD